MTRKLHHYGNSMLGADKTCIILSSWQASVGRRWPIIIGKGLIFDIEIAAFGGIQRLGAITLAELGRESRSSPAPRETYTGERSTASS